MQIAVFAVFALIALWLTAVWPGKGRKERMEVFSEQLIAHRGLHCNKSDAPENSLLAFRRAVSAGYGIELDVRETKDEALVICHDDSLRRVAGLKGKKISEMPLREVKQIRLFRSEQTIPTLEEALSVIRGRVPIIVEIKSENMRDVARVSAHTAELLDSYQGMFCVESFNPASVRWFRKNRPETLRGQLSDQFHDPFPDRLLLFLFSCCVFNFLTKPDFIAYRYSCSNLMRFRILHDLFHACCAGWTIRSREALEQAAPVFDVIIFDGFTPPGGKGAVGIDPEASGDDSGFDDESGWLEEEAGGEESEGADGREGEGFGSGDGEKSGGSGMGDRTGGEPGARVRRHLRVHGRVTEVGFRYRAVNIAHLLGVTGWVKNAGDGCVEMEIQGKPAEIDEMMRRLREQRFIEITDVEERDTDVLPGEYEFKVRL